MLRISRCFCRAQVEKRYAGIFPRAAAASYSLILFLFAVVAVPTVLGQARSIPDAPKGEPELPRLRCLVDKPEFHPLRYRVHFQGREIPLLIQRVTGRTITGRTEQRVEATIEATKLVPYNQLLLDFFMIRGEVKPFALEVAQEAQLAKYGLRALVYERPGVPYPEQGGGVPWTRPGRLPFLLYSPPDAGPDKPYPLIVFLHGIGGRGTDNWKPFAEDGGGVDKHFGNLISRDWQKHTPCHVMIPQSSEGNNWWYQKDPLVTAYAVRLTGQAIDVLEARHKTGIDLTRLYVTGFSGGGYGCYEFMRVFPGKFAAAVPMACHNNEIEIFAKPMAIPQYLFVNEGDKSIAWRWVRWERNLWKAWGVPWKVEVFEGASGHGVWNRAYGDAEFRRWLKTQKLPQQTWPSDTSAWLED
jgi:predicted esterase